MALKHFRRTETRKITLKLTRRKQQYDSTESYVFCEFNCVEEIYDSSKFLFSYKMFFCFALLMTKTWQRKINVVYWLDRCEMAQNCAAQKRIIRSKNLFPIFIREVSEVHYQQIMRREKFYCNRYYLVLAEELLPPLNRCYWIFHRVSWLGNQYMRKLIFLLLGSRK